MTDAATTWLIQNIQQHATSSSIWFSDENVLRMLPDANSWNSKPAIISNRWDIAEHATQLGFTASFSDFDLREISSNSIDHIFYRISKEKPVVHHLINESHRLLKKNGTLWICGQKNEGIKTYIEKATALFSCKKNIQKNGMSYSSELCKTDNTGQMLDDENYHQLRPCLTIHNHLVQSKPGQFGWNKLDQGSEFLINTLCEIIPSNTSINTSLDLGCGYGYLTIAAQKLSIQSFTLTDNNAAALITARYNCDQLKINADVLPSDAGMQIHKQFDLILCNPPFHQGFSVDGDLTDKFLKNAHTLLSDNGVAYFVVNQFIPLEKKAAAFFKQIKLIAKNKSFNIVELRKN